MGKRVRITVLKADFYQDLADRYAIDDLGVCPRHREGQVFYSDGSKMPEGMCGPAWASIAPWVKVLSEGGLLQPSGTWLKDDSKGVFACPDGIRPVVFLLEAED